MYVGGCRWIRLPAIIYGTHVSTTLIPILYHIMTADFSSQLVDDNAAVTVSGRLALASVYAPYLIVPLMLVYHMLTSPQYVSSLKQQ